MFQKTRTACTNYYHESWPFASNTLYSSHHSSLSWYFPCSFPSLQPCAHNVPCPSLLQGQARFQCQAFLHLSLASDSHEGMDTCPSSSQAKQRQSLSLTNACPCSKLSLAPVCFPAHSPQDRENHLLHESPVGRHTALSWDVCRRLHTLTRDCGVSFL